jgi:type IV pilus assembly protein PilV
MTRYRRARASKGFSLIEVLVGILIFAVGVLGIVGLQVSMTRAQTAGKFRSDAAYLANELIGSMWGDIPNIAKYASAQCASHGPCADWAAKVVTLLPGGTTVVTSDAASGEVHITIKWTVPNEGDHVYETWTNVQ